MFSTCCARVLVNIKLGHQNSLNSSPKQPCSSMKALYSLIAALFSLAHFSASALANSCFSACSKVAERFIFMALVLDNKSLFKLRLVGFFGALSSYKWCMKSPKSSAHDSTHCYAQCRAFNKAVNIVRCRTLGQPTLRCGWRLLGTTGKNASYVS